MYINVIVRNSFHFKTYSFNLGDNPNLDQNGFRKMEISMPAMNETFERVSQRNKRLTGQSKHRRRFFRSFFFFKHFIRSVTSVSTARDAATKRGRLTGGKPEKRVEATRYRVSTFSLCPLAVAFRELTSIIFLGAAYPK